MPDAPDIAPNSKRHSEGAALITAERLRQVNVEGWTASHDNEHDACELTMAADGYLWHAVGQVNGVCWPEGYDSIPPNWPWHMDWWKPADDPIRNLVKAGALIAAEIDRLLFVRAVDKIEDGEGWQR